MSSVPVLSGVDVVSAACPGDRRCVVVGNLASGSVSSGPPVRDGGVVLVSVDGGSTWSPGRIAGSAVRLLGGLSCPAVTRCYATASGVGSSSRGFLLVSSDGGRRWSARRRGPRGGLSGALSCVGVDRCLAAGGDGLVETTDGGLRWRAEREPMGAGGFPSVSGLACPTATTCVGVGSESHPGYPVIFTSTDGGPVWGFAPVTTSRSQRALVQQATGGYSAVSCAAQQCLAVARTFSGGGLVAHSSDGGRAWMASALGQGAALTSVACVASAGCIAGGATAAGAPLLARSGPTGRWSVGYKGPATDATALSCPTSSYCVAGFGNSPVATGAEIAVSRDGGRRWTPGRLPADVVGVSAIDCPTDRRCLAAATIPAPARYQQQGELSVAEMLVSSDGGRLWRPDRLPVIPAALQAITCPTPNACYSVGTTADIGSIQVPGDVILETSDGGRRWTSQPIPVFPQPPSGTSGDAIPGSGLTSISCTNPDTCVAGGPAGVLATTDGTRWRIRYETPTPGYGNQEASSPPGQLQLLACPTPSACVGVFTNANGGDVIRRSANGGRTWTPEPSAPKLLAAAALVCPAITECLIGGTNSHGATLLETFDTARQWQPAPLPALGTNDTSRTPPEYGAVTCPTATDCLALGAGAIGEVAISHS